jgi:hypothetical protein
MDNITLAMIKGRLVAGGTTFEVTKHPYSPKHLLLKVTSRGRVYACISALQDDLSKAATPAMVRYLWKHNRHEFLPYNESLGTFSIPSKVSN